MIMKSAGVPFDSIYIKEAEKNNPRLGGASTPIEMDVSLFIKLAPEVMLIGVTGTRGKSMTTALIYEILKQNEKFLGKKVFLGGNVRGVATLPLLKEAKSGDILVCELDSWQLQGFGEAKISPHISVFTSFMPDHMNYYRNDMNAYFNDKANIFKYQKKEDILIIRPDVEKLIKNFPSTLQGEGKGEVLKSKLIIVNAKDVEGYKFIVPGEYQRENLACAVEVAKQFNIPESNIQKAVEGFKGLEGRLQYIKTVKGVEIYNDNNATTPEATIAGIEALSARQGLARIILICGGADKGLDLDNFIKVVNKYCKVVVTIPGIGTDKLLALELKAKSFKVGDLKEAINEAIKQSQKGDIILFSPAFASFGMFNNEYERNDLFMKIIKDLK